MPSYALIKYRPPLPPSLCTWREGGTESTGGVGRQEPPVRSRMLTAGNCDSPGNCGSWKSSTSNTFLHFMVTT